jgi:hypothetical protein
MLTAALCLWLKDSFRQLLRLIDKKTGREKCPDSVLTLLAANTPNRIYMKHITKINKPLHEGLLFSDDGLLRYCRLDT